MCTKDDLTELQRATHLLRKGYEIQKLAVSFLNLIVVFTVGIDHKQPAPVRQRGGRERRPPRAADQLPGGLGQQDAD